MAVYQLANPAWGTGTAHPDYSYSGAKFIPQIWSGKLLRKFYASTFLSEITNTIYEGEIKKQGDTVIIRTVPDITIRNHTMGAELSYERPTSSAIQMLIDKGKYFAFLLDDVAKVQSDLNLLNAWLDDAAMQMKVSIESSFLQDSNIYDGCHSDNKGTAAGAISGSYNLGSSSTPLEVTPVNVLDIIVDCGCVLEEQNVPMENPWMIIPTWMAGLIKKSDIKDSSLTGDGQSVLRTGRIGVIDRFTVYSSNLLYSAGNPKYYYAMFGIPYAISFATQLTKTEHLRSEHSFDDIVRGLQVYGYKVIKPEAYGVMVVRKG